MKALAGKEGAENLRFFGKIRGTDNDYYIAEGKVDGGDGDDGGEEKAADFEGAGTGVNSFTYWVSH